MEELESGLLRRATRLVDAAYKAWQPESLRSHHRSKRGISTDRAAKLVDSRPRDEGRSRVRAKPEEASANRARHARSVHAAEMTMARRNEVAQKGSPKER